jgi:hypothetical protein
MSSRGESITKRILRGNRRFENPLCALNSCPIQPVEQSGELDSRQIHDPVHDRRPAERSEETLHRQIKYLNNTIESDHGKLKQPIRPVRGFKTLQTAYATIKGFEVMHALRKRQASAFNITRDIRGEARIVERAFGLGASIPAEAVQFVSAQLELEAA